MTSADPLLLASLGQHFLATASNIARASEPRNVPRSAVHDTTTYCLRESIRCFTAILSTPSLSPVLEVQTRLQIAEALLDHTENVVEAEVHLQKSLHLCSKLNRQHSENADLYFRTRHAICRVYALKKLIKQALTLTREALSEAETLHMPTWVYHFYILMSTVESAHVEPVKSRAVLIDAANTAERNRDWEVQALFLIHHACASLAASDLTSCSSSLSRASELFKPPSPPSTLPLPSSSDMLVSNTPTRDTATPVPPRGTTPFPVPLPPATPPTPTSRVSNPALYKLLALISAWLAVVGGSDPPNVGSARAAQIWLAALKKEGGTVGEREGEGVMVTHLRSRPHSSAPQPLITPTLPPSHTAILTSLLTALSSMGSDPQRARRYATDVVAKVDGERFKEPAAFPIPPAQSQSWHLHVKLLSLHVLVQACVAVGDWGDAGTHLTALASHISIAPDLETQWDTVLALDVGVLLMATGRGGDAVQWFEGAAGKTDLDNFETRFAAMLNLALLHCGDGARDLPKASFIIASLEHDLSRYPIIPPPHMYTAALHFAKGVLAAVESDGAVGGEKTQEAKAHLTAALKHSDSTLQVKAMTLAVLGDVFMQLDPGRAERMLFTSHSIARKIKLDVLVGAVGGPLADLKHRSGQTKEAAEIAKAAQKLRAEVGRKWDAASHVRLV
ncbi:hypothetical protein M427DRAFT_30653 [Gonapodya prolifera JEL478]|uniref:Cohesin loading factor n=1 Tax=Gonapodya prolifera (strain JEL478) TaxID=1344416 RepID=A0A139AK88_GONPJ|nr:hypothetical protein M427DRAFT_30653 [Gonapodya prolifera JEL478]|eukprot:KXS17189.1 hypothetical protein M427DRAFT_30653 [Gonapodya prolifera JEL478]